MLWGKVELPKVKDALKPLLYQCPLQCGPQKGLQHEKNDELRIATQSHTIIVVRHTQVNNAIWSYIFGGLNGFATE